MGIVLPKRFNEFDVLIKKWAGKYRLPWMLIKAQVWQESSFNPAAISSCGACGLLQLMPATAKEMGLKIEEIFDIEKNLDCGMRYLRIQYDHFPEILDPQERWKFAMAAYNGGRGNDNKAIKKAIEQCQLAMYEEDPSAWQDWQFVQWYLPESCDAHQIRDYVEKIWGYYQENKNALP